MNNPPNTRIDHSSRDVASQRASNPFRGPAEEPWASARTDREVDELIRETAESAEISAGSSGVISTDTESRDPRSCWTFRPPMTGAMTAGCAPTQATAAFTWCRPQSLKNVANRPATSCIYFHRSAGRQQGYTLLSEPLVTEFISRCSTCVAHAVPSIASSTRKARELSK